jgi:MoaA/NifB/PqqE/SkfB family radical SAM enzyme
MINLYNIASTVGVKYDHKEPLNNRAKLDTGTHCNYRCGFCYYKTQLNDITEFSIIKDRIDYLVECGITEVDLSGGESSIHKEWFEILDYCKGKGLKISTLSNGYKFAKMDFMQKSKDHGLDEILFSVHGYDDESHDELVGRKHGFKNIIKAIKNAQECGVLVRVNCTVTKDNFSELNTKFVNLMKELKPFEINFLTLNYWDDADSQNCISYAEITPYVKEAIDKLIDDIEIINVRYTPYCFMKGYEKHVCNYYQHIYDIYDWNIAVYDGDIEAAVYKENRHLAMYKSVKKNRMTTYYKKKECLECKHYLICDGIENQIREIDVYPEAGQKIKDVNHYRVGWYSG